MDKDMITSASRDAVHEFYGCNGGRITVRDVMGIAGSVRAAIVPTPVWDVTQRTSRTVLSREQSGQCLNRWRNSHARNNFPREAHRHREMGLWKSFDSRALRDATICANESENNNVLIKHDVNSDTVGQYTGLKDRNGTEVWEGDLLRTPEGDIMVAEWIDAKIITRCVRPYNPRYKNSLTFAYPVSVVVGNIHDNPELLEEGK